MKIKIFCLSALFSIAIATHPTVQAADSTLATEQLAEIIIDMKGKPVKDAKITLEDIARDTASTTNERILAESILKMDKKIQQKDKPRILKIWTSPAASETERSLARALLKFDESVDKTSKETLSQITQ